MGMLSSEMKGAIWSVKSEPEMQLPQNFLAIPFTSHVRMGGLKLEKRMATSSGSYKIIEVAILTYHKGTNDLKSF